MPLAYPSPEAVSKWVFLWYVAYVAAFLALAFGLYFLWPAE